jgi:meso-butanediol dehydrogenase / (S,S)-butanediol dehydrogenase / diacetyl reductase
VTDNVSSRVALVTGGGSGIGLATVNAFLELDDRVVVLDRDPFPPIDGAAERVEAVQGDVADPAVNEKAVALAVERFGGLDIAVLNAGVLVAGHLLSLPIEDLDRSIEVNVKGVVHGIRAAAAVLRPGGRIVVTASESGLAADPSLWAYNTAKGAVVNLVKAAALDLCSRGITVNAVCPGPIDTALAHDLRHDERRWEASRRAVPMQRWGRPEEVAAVIRFLASPEASFLTGVALPVDGGIAANTGQFRPRAF